MLYVAIIDGDDPNHYSQQNLDNDENIRSFTLPLDNKIA
jgi:hypothetical protein